MHEEIKPGCGRGDRENRETEAGRGLTIQFLFLALLLVPLCLIFIFIFFGMWVKGSGAVQTPGHDLGSAFCPFSHLEPPQPFPYLCLIFFFFFLCSSGLLAKEVKSHPALSLQEKGGEKKLSPSSSCKN